MQGIRLINGIMWNRMEEQYGREKRVEARKKRKQGIDPIKEKLEKKINTKEQEHEKEIEDQRKGTTFEKVAQERSNGHSYGTYKRHE